MKTFNKKLETLKINNENVETIHSFKIEEKKGQFSVFVEYNNLKTYLISKYNPINEAKRAVSKLNLDDKDSIFVIGSPFLYLVKEIYKNYRDLKIILIEIDKELFLETIKNVDIDDLDIIVLFKDDNFSKKIIFENIEFSRIEFYINPVYKKVYNSEVELIIKKIKKLLSDKKKLINTEISSSAISFINGINNLKHLKKSYSFHCLKDALKGIPAVIVSSGPSIQKNYHHLKNIKDKSLVIACGTSNNFLYNNGIKPHYSVEIDYQKCNLNKYKRMNLTFENDLICTLDINMDILKYYNKDRYYILTSNLIMQYVNDYLFNNRNSLSAGGSVATVAFETAYFLGCDPIVFIGQDLAFSGSNTHFKGSHHDKAIIELINRFQSYEMLKHKILTRNKGTVTKGYYGDLVETDEVLLFYLNWFSNRFSKVNDRTIINATEGGALIENCKNLSFKESIDRYFLKNVDILHRIKSNAKRYKTIDIDEVSSHVICSIDEFINRCKTILSKDILDAKNDILELFDFYNKHYYFNMLFKKNFIMLSKNVDNQETVNKNLEFFIDALEKVKEEIY